jgi:hypothetical protein
MANITLTTTESNIVVDATNNIINVTSTPTTVVVAQGTGLDVPGVRASISNIAPILYNSTTGVISFDANATFSGKTTDDLPQGVSNIYFSTTGAAVNTTNLPEGANLYFTDARVLNTINTGNVTLKKYQETYLDAGTTNGNVALNAALGTIQKITLNGDLTGLNLSNLSTGGSFTLLIAQDSFGSRLLNTTSGWGTWIFANNLRTLSAAPNAIDLLTLTYDGTTYFASLVPFGATFIPNSQLANSNVIVNGTTISLGSSGNISHFGALTTTNLPEGANLYFTASRVRSNVSGASLSGISYDSSSGTFSLVNIPNSSLTNSAITINGTSVSLGGTRTLTTSDIAEGTNLYFTAARANSNVVSHIATVPLTVGGNLTVNGNINATGNINVQNVEDLYVRDQTIVMNANAASPANVQIVANRPGFANTEIKWNEQADRWTFTNDGTTYYNLPTSTTDVAEGANLYYSNARVNSFIQDNITTTDIDEGTNLYFTAARARGNISAAENITYNSGTGVIGLANALGNVNTVTSQASTNLTLNSDNRLVVTERLKGVATNVGNISGDGYGLVVKDTFNLANATPIAYNGSSNLLTYVAIAGATTLGSNVITGITTLIGPGGSPGASISSIILNSLVFDGQATNTYPFPPGTFVTQLDAANSQVFVSQNATANVTFNPATGTVISFRPGAYDSSTGQSIAFRTSGDLTLGGNAANIIQTFSTSNVSYGYPASGFTPSDFNFYSVGTANNYTITRDISNLFQGRTQLEAPRTVMNLPRGLVVGNGDMTNRAENDPFPTFGINVLWDGLTSNVDYGGNNPATQLLIKSYTDNNAQSDSTAKTTSGPRIFFTAAEGNKNQPYQVTYPRNNLELGRITWWSGAQNAPPAQLSTLAAPAFISVVTNRDMTGNHNGGVGMYLSASPNNNVGRRGLFVAHQLGDTLIASSNATSSGASLPITFAPMWTAATATTAGNAVSQFNNTMGATNYQWANVNYDNPTAYQGSRLSITNGASTVAGRNGNLTLALDRNNNGAGFGDKKWALKLRPGQTDLVLTEDDVIRTTFAGANITTAGNVTASTFLGNVNGAIATLSGNVTAGNVITSSVSSPTSTNLTLNTDKKLILSQQYKNTTTYSGNISGQGYAVIGGRIGTAVVHSSANALPTLRITGGFTIAGTNEIANVTVQWQGNSAAASVSDIKSHYAFAKVFGRTNQTPFPQGTYVTSVDAANSKVFMSQIETTGVNAGVSNGAFTPAARDPETGLLISFISAQAAGIGAANVIVETLVHTSGLYAYPATGWDPSYFTYAIGTASDYNMSGTTNLAWAKTSIEGNKSILNSPYGLTLGSRTDPSQMGTDDTRPRFGLNILWDGLTPPAEFGNVTPTTGILLRQYNNPAIDSQIKAASGPSVIFTVSEGNASQSFAETYARNNTELGKIAWVIPNNSNPQPSFNNPQTWINCLTGQDADIGNGSVGARVSGAGMYFGNSPDVLTSGRALYFANTKGRTLLAGGYEGSTTANITLAPMDTTINTGNSVQMYDNAIVGKLFANVGYANMSSQTGSRLTITNGAQVSAPGNFVIEIDRNVTPAGVANVVLDAAPFGIMDGGDVGGIPNRALVGIYYSGVSGIAPTTTAITLNSVTGPGAANVNGQTFYINDTESMYGATAYYLYSDAGLTTPVTYSSLGTEPYTTDGGFLEYTATPSSVSKNWSFELEEAVEDLKLKADGNTVVTFTDTGNINLATNATINYDAVYGCFHNMANVTAAAADTVYEFQWPNVHINTNRVTVAGNSQITIGQEGAYNFALEMQAENTDNQDRTAFIWLAKNGTDIAETCLRVSLLKEWKQVIVKEWIVNGINANDYIEVRFAVDNPSGIQLTSIPAQASPYARPAVPAAVITVTPVGA